MADIEKIADKLRREQGLGLTLVGNDDLNALLDELSRLMEVERQLRKDLTFADEQSAKVEALLEPHVRWECASEDCGKPAIVHFERGGIGSYYCHECYMRIQALPARALSERKEGQADG